MAARVSCICKYFLPTGTRCCHYYYTLKYIKKKKSVLQVRAALKGSSISIPLVNNTFKNAEEANEEESVDWFRQGSTYVNDRNNDIRHAFFS